MTAFKSGQKRNGSKLQAIQAALQRRQVHGLLALGRRASNLGLPEQMSLVLLSVEVNRSTCNSVASPNCRQSMSTLEGLECEECKRLVLF